MAVELEQRKIIPQAAGHFRLAATVLLALIGIGTIIYYTICDTACAYLRGDILTIDLKYIGMGYMAAVIALSLFKKRDYLRILLALGVGAEIYLVAFQYAADVYCPYCLVFGCVVVLAFLVNHEQAERQKDLPTTIFYGLGEAAAPFLTKKLPLLLFIIIGYLLVVITFTGSATPAYGAERPRLPSFGKGPEELIIFTDYFCPPCQRVEGDLEPVLEELLAEGKVRVSFIDLPINRLTPLYAAYFLFIVQAGGDYKEVLQGRKFLFELAMTNAAPNEEILVQKLRERGIRYKQYDHRPVYEIWNRSIQQYKVNATPTCVVRYSAKEWRRYTGGEEIKKGLAELRAAFLKK